MCKKFGGTKHRNDPEPAIATHSEPEPPIASNWPISVRA